MLNKFARTILTMSTISPVCLSIALLVAMTSSAKVSVLDKATKLWEHLCLWQLTQKEAVFLLSVLMFFISLLPFKYVLNEAKKQSILIHPTQAFTITNITPAHKEMTNYFISYLFPLMAGGELLSNIYIAIFFYCTIFVWNAYSGAYTFNPVLSFMGYKFYEADRSSNVNIILITKEILLDIHNTQLKVVRLTEHTYLQIKDT